MQLGLYRTFSYLAGPFIDLYLIGRKFMGKEDPRRFSERLGKPGFPRAAGPLVWVHAASVGEAMSVLPLVERVIDMYQDVNVLVTTGTVTSAKVLDGRLPSRAFHQYVPVDKLVTVRRFLAHWRPDFALWVESELWPNLIIETSSTGCSMVQINARMSPTSYEKFQRYGNLAKEMLSCFSLCLAQSEEDKKRFEKLGARNAKYVGNLKYDAPTLPADPAETGKMVTMVGERPLWVAASTHPGEEKIIAKVHKTLKAQNDNILTIITPRHPERGEDILNNIKDDSLKIALRSKDEEITDDTDIYIADTIGELGIFYRLSSIVFVGGSLVEHGGQNPLEAARLECALLTGPHTENFIKIYDELETEKAVIRVTDAESLAENVNKLLADNDLQEKYADTALEIMKTKEGVIDAYIKELAPYLKPISRKIKSIEGDENT